MGSSLAWWLKRQVSLIKLDVVGADAPPVVGGMAGTIEGGSGVEGAGTEDVGVVFECPGRRVAAGFAAAGRAPTFALPEVRATPAAVPPPTTARRATTTKITLNRKCPTAVAILDMMEPPSSVHDR